MQLKAMLVLAAFAIGITEGGAQSPAPNTCFPLNEMRAWKAADNKTLYIRVSADQYYRLDLVPSCPMLTFPTSHLITRTRGSDLICSAVDWDLSVSEGPPAAMPSPCIVKQMTLLTPEQAAAIPKKFKP
ncbi:MAG TPA: DUF6491 family protein [Rhizomicrobium sp.]|jgi:hypothetical protein